MSPWMSQQDATGDGVNEKDVSACGNSGFPVFALTQCFFTTVGRVQWRCLLHHRIRVQRLLTGLQKLGCSVHNLLVDERKHRHGEIIVTGAFPLLRHWEKGNERQTDMEGRAKMDSSRVELKKKRLQRPGVKCKSFILRVQNQRRTEGPITVTKPQLFSVLKTSSFHLSHCQM